MVTFQQRTDWSKGMIYEDSGGNTVQAERTACAKALRHPQLLWEQVKSSVQLKQSRQWHSGTDRFGEVNRGQTIEVLKDYGRGFGFYFKHDEKLVDDCEQRSKMAWFLHWIDNSACYDHTHATCHHFSCRSTYTAIACPSLRILYSLFKYLMTKWITECIHEWMNGSSSQDFAYPRQTTICYISH